MSIQAAGNFSAEDVWRGARVVARRHFAIASVFGLTILAIALLLTYTGASLQEQLAFYSLSPLPVGYYWVTMLLQARTQAKGNPNLKSTVSFAFDETGYVAEAAHTRIEVKWSGIVKWKEGKHCFAIYTSPKVASIIPKRFFQSPKDVDVVRGFLRTIGPSSS